MPRYYLQASSDAEARAQAERIAQKVPGWKILAVRPRQHGEYSPVPRATHVALVGAETELVLPRQPLKAATAGVSPFPPVSAASTGAKAPEPSPAPASSAATPTDAGKESAESGDKGHAPAEEKSKRRRTPSPAKPKRGRR